MQTTTDEIAPDVFRISTFVPEVGPTGFTFNQFLIRADEPLLFHTGPRGMFPAVHGAAAKLIPIESLRWITFGHVESDECGSMNQWLEAAPEATVKSVAWSRSTISQTGLRERSRTARC